MGGSAVSQPAGDVPPSQKALVKGTASEEEFNFLEQIIETSQQEQKAKDVALMKALTDWFENVLMAKQSSLR